MNAIVQAGAINPAATLVAGVYTVIVPPPVVLQGAPTDILGLVGAASWGPVGLPVAVGDPSGATSSFGAQANRKHDLVSAVSIAALQGANSFRMVRATDGTDAAATDTIAANALAVSPNFFAALAAALNAGAGVLRGPSAFVRFNAATGVLTALYTGIVGNTVSIAVGKGSKVGTFRAAVSAQGRTAEVFDNLPGEPATVVNVSYALAGGTDGDAGVTAHMLVGQDVAPRTGMYALRGQGCSAMALVECDDPTAWSEQVPFCQSEGLQGYVAGAAGDTVTTGPVNKSSAGIDDYSMSVLLGDWLYWQDDVNNVLRLVSPATVAAGKRVALAPNESILNKPLFGILGSQRSGEVGNGALVSYTSAELEVLVLAGIDVVGNPAPGGSYWSALVGHNSSSDASRQSDSYTQMTDFLARTINGGMGIYVGKPNSLPWLRRIAATLRSLCANVETVGLIGDDDGSVPYSVTCDLSNNPNDKRGLGYTQADVRIRYQGITEKLLVNLEGGATVTIGSSSTAS